MSFEANITKEITKTFGSIFKNRIYIGNLITTNISLYWQSVFKKNSVLNI